MQLFKAEFPSTVDVVAIAGHILRDHVAQSITIAGSPDRVSPDSFDLYFKLQELNSFLQEEIPSIEVISLDAQFGVLITKWIDQTKNKLKEWTSRMVQGENVRKLVSDQQTYLINEILNVLKEFSINKHYLIIQMKLKIPDGIFNFIWMIK